MTVIEKPCSRCKETKQASEFYKDKATKTGLFSWCKQCCREYKRTPERIAKDRKRKKTRGFAIHKDGNKFAVKHNNKTLGRYGSREACKDVIAKYKARQARRKIEDQKASHDDYWDTL